MKKQDEKIVYGAYYRKSSEDDRQVNSIQDQERDLDAIELKENLKYIKKTDIVCGKFEDLLISNRYDFIQTSNLTDWMDKETFDSFCLKLLNALKLGGILIMRRLLSDNILINKFHDSIKLKEI